MDGVSVSSYRVGATHAVRARCRYIPPRGRIALAYNGGANAHLGSSIYTVFRLRNGLLPEYLYMLFKRSEFDRYARYNSWGSARENFNWDELGRARIPLPPSEVQQAIVVNLYRCMEAARGIAQEARELRKALRSFGRQQKARAWQNGYGHEQALHTFL